MTNLADFGGGIDQPETEHETDDEDSGDDRYKYSAGRCRAIAKSNGRRCRGSASEGDLCYYHEHENDPVTIDSDPITLIEWTSRKLFRNLGDLDVDEELIRQAVHNIYGLEDEPIPVYDDGIWLPVRYAEAAHLIIRSPTGTHESRLSGSEPRRRIYPAFDAGAWDSDYLAGEGRTAKIKNDECLPDEDDVPKVGLKIAGEEQRWLPVEIDVDKSDEEYEHDLEAIAEAFGVETDAIDITAHEEIDGAFTFTAPIRTIDADTRFIANDIADIGYDVTRSGENADREWFVTARTGDAVEGGDRDE